MIDERARTLLKTLIEHYIADGQPVGSRALSRLSGLDLSPIIVFFGIQILLGLLGC